MADWHIKIGDEVIGPVSSAELLAKVRLGEVTPNTLLQKGNSQWVAAEEVNGLFEAIGQTALEYHCPQCREEIHKPPIHCDFCGTFVERAEMQRFPVKPVRTEQDQSTRDLKSFWGNFSQVWKRWTE